jgi:hypothetical protein
MSGWGGKYETGDLGQFEAGTTKILIAYVAQLHPSTNFRLRLVCTDSRGRRWTTTTTGDMGRRLIAKKGPNNALD